MGFELEKKYSGVEAWISRVVQIIILCLIGIVMIGMVELIFGIAKDTLLSGELANISLMIKEVATFFILLEIILMLLKYLQDIHHIPVKYIIVISITAIAREMLLIHGNDTKMFFLSLAIFVLVCVLYLIEKSNLFQDM